MIKQPKFTDEVYQMYREKLEVIGFLRGKGSISKNIFYKELCKGFSGRIGLNVTSRTRGGYQVVNIYPIIGIHDEELEKTLSKIMGLKPHIYTPPTCGRPLGYISPESTYVSWLCVRDDPLAETIEALVKAIESYALPYMNDHASRIGIRELLEIGHRRPTSLDECLPLLYLMEGEVDNARAYLLHQIAFAIDLWGPENKSVQTYREFADKLLLHMTGKGADQQIMERNEGLLLRQEIINTCYHQFKKLGLLNREETVFIREMPGDFRGILTWTLPAIARNGQMVYELDPIVGVRDQELHRLVKEKEGGEWHPYLPPTASIQLGCLMPEQSPLKWTIGPEDHVEERVSELADAIRCYGFPYMEKNAHREAICTLIEQGQSKPFVNEKHLPALYTLLGRERKTREYIRQMAERKAQLFGAHNVAVRSYIASMESIIDHVRQ